MTSEGVFVECLKNNLNLIYTYLFKTMNKISGSYFVETLKQDPFSLNNKKSVVPQGNKTSIHSPNIIGFLKSPLLLAYVSSTSSTVLGISAILSEEGWYHLYLLLLW